MSYPANVFNLFLASPSDVSEERKVAREIILDWNNINSATRKIVLMPIGWEYNTSPSLGGRPQEIINNQILNTADLLIGIFWTRVGTPTGRALSGTVEEIEKHINSGKPAMLYFSQKPVIPDSIDPVQYDAVKKLKKEYQDNGLTESFDSVDDFQRKFQRQLALKINQDSFFRGLDEIQLKPGFESQSLNERISEDAIFILMKAGGEDAGQVIRLDSIGDEYSLEAGLAEIVHTSTHRERARWEAALQELIRIGYLNDVSFNGEIFDITHEGYEFLDKMKTSS